MGIIEILYDILPPAAGPEVLIGFFGTVAAVGTLIAGTIMWAGRRLFLITTYAITKETLKWIGAVLYFLYAIHLFALRWGTLVLLAITPILIIWNASKYLWHFLIHYKP